MLKKHWNLEVPANKYGNIVKNTKPFTTTVGLWVLNKYLLEKNFDKYLGYINRELTGSEWEKAILNPITRGVLEDELTQDSICELLEKTQKLMPLSTPLTPSISENILLISSVIEPKKKELAKKYAKELEAGDAVIAEQMKAELIKYALDTLGDDPALDIYFSGARSNINNHFATQYIMKGAIRNPDPLADKQFNIALSNYNNGISKEEYPIFCNSLAGGPYSRAVKTGVGGHVEKMINSGYQHIRLDKHGSDCGTTDYVTELLTDSNVESWMYSYIIDDSTKTLVELNSKTYKKYLGKKVKIRFSALCESTTGICNKCIGELFYKLNVTNIGLLVMIVGSDVKNNNMKAFHDSTAKTVRFNALEAFGE